MFRTRSTDPRYANEAELELYLDLKRLLSGPDGRMLAGWEAIWGYYYRFKGISREGDFLLLTPGGDIIIVECKGYQNELPEDSDPLLQLNAQRDGIRSSLNYFGVKTIRTHMVLALPRAQDKARLILAGLSPANHLYPDNIGSNEDFTAWKKKLIPHDDLHPERAKLQTWWEKQFRNLPAHLQFNLSAAHMESAIRQKRFLFDALAANRTLLFIGGAGTGKTWYAQEYTTRALGTGRRVLFLVYNKLLAEHLCGVFADVLTLKNSPLTLLTWEEFAALLYNSSKEALPVIPDPAHPSATKLDYLAIAARLPALAATAAREKFANIDTLVVDEAQDHNTAHHASDTSGGWWTAYQKIFPQWDDLPKAIFADPSQRASFRDRSGARFDLANLKHQLGSHTQINLPHNLRYTRLLLSYLLEDLAHPATENLRKALSGPMPADQGYPVTTREAEKNKTAAAVQDQLEAWTTTHSCPPSSVLILSRYGNPLTDASAALAGLTNITVHGKVYLLNQHGLVAPGEDAITVTSFHRAKGLDAPAVILLDVWKWNDYGEGNDEQRVAFWLAASRARLLLTVITRSRSLAPQRC